MKRTEYDWTTQPRYAAPVGTFLPIRGFLPKVQDDPWLSLNPLGPKTARSLDFWYQSKVVVLLGEAGIGKTFELERWYNIQKKQNVTALKIRLGVETLAGFHRSWCDHPEIRQWLEGDGELELFLDGIDEVLVNPRDFVAELNGFLNGVGAALDRLKLRLSSRPYAWTTNLTKVLARVAGNEEVVVLSLLPLTEEDARQAASSLGINEPAGFLDWVREKKLESFASRPLTLPMLQKAYSKGSESLSRKDLFEGQIYSLFCGSGHETRPDLSTTTPQRMAIAGRIAAATLFSNRPLIVDFSISSNESSLQVKLDELGGGEEGIEEKSRVNVTRQTLEETIGISPFQQLEEGLFLWSSRAYEEFLAARYLASYQPDQNTLDAVISNKNDPERRIAPALRGAVGWLAHFMPNLWETLAQRDPKALLETDLQASSEENRRVLIDALLDKIKENNIHWDISLLTQSLGDLKHLGIVEQLKQRLDPNKNTADVVQTAAFLAGETSAVGCIPQLITLVEQTGVGEYLYTAAFYAMQSLHLFWRDGITPDGDQEHVITLCQHVLGYSSEQDSRDNLLGMALEILWPQSLSTPELLPKLRRPYGTNHWGTYQTFLVYRFVEEVEDEHLATILGWAAEHSKLDGVNEKFPHASSMLERLLSRVANRWLKNGTPEQNILIAIFRAVLDEYIPVSIPGELQEMLREKLGEPATLEAALIACDTMESWQTHGFILRLHRRFGVAMELLWNGAWEGLQATEDPTMQERFATAIDEATNPADLAQVKRLLEEGEKFPCLGDAIKKLKQLGKNPEAIVSHLKNVWEQKQSQWQMKEESVTLDPPLEQRVLDSIEQAQGGDGEAFWKMLHNLARKPTDRDYRVDWRKPFWEAYGWQQLDDNDRRRALDATHQFLLNNDPKPGLWLGKANGRESGHAFMGIAAFRLLFHENPTLVEAFSTDLLAKWAPAIIDHDSLFDSSDSFAPIFRLLISKVPEAVAKTWVASYEGDNGYLSLRAFGRDGWCPAVKDAFVEALSRQTDPKRVGWLLVELLKKDVEEAKEYAEAKINLIRSDKEQNKEWGHQAVFALLRSGSSSVLKVFDYLDEHSSDARKILLRLGKDILFDDQVNTTWSVALLGRFAQLLATYFPPESDPESAGARSIGAEDQLRFQRDKCLVVLAQHAKLEGVIDGENKQRAWDAVDELRRLEQTFPSWKNVRHYRTMATEHARLSSWHPPTPEKVLDIIRKGIRDETTDKALDLSSLVRNDSIERGAETTTLKSKSITAFISYSHDSHAHAAKVKQLADTLRRRGIHSQLDQYTMPQGPPEGWPRWMERNIQDAAFVVCVCSPTYRKRIEGKEEYWKGKGVDWEGNILYNLLYRSKGEGKSIIPVLFDDEPEDSIPLVISGLHFHRLPGGFETLYRHITNQPGFVMSNVTEQIVPLTTKKQSSMPSEWEKALVLGTGTHNRVLVGDLTMFDYRKADYEDLCILSLQGYLNALTAEQMRAVIQELVLTQQRYLILDLSSLELIDSSGVGALVSLFKRVKIFRGQVKMAGLRGQPSEIFRLLNLHKVFDLCINVDEAVREFLGSMPREEIPAPLLEKWGILLK